MKCNPSRPLLAALASLGAGFDCASEAEVGAVLGLGVPPSRIIYAHPCKPPSQARACAGLGMCVRVCCERASLARTLSQAARAH